MIAESLSFRSAAMTGRLAFLDTGAGSASLQVYGGTRPAAGAAPGTPLLCAVTLTKPAGTINASSQLVLTQAADGLIEVGGTAVWCRVVNGADAFCFDLDAGLVGNAAAEAQFDSVTLFAGGGLRLVSCVLG